MYRKNYLNLLYAVSRREAACRVARMVPGSLVRDAVKYTTHH